MIFTPTNLGEGIAGVGTGVFSWSAFLKCDKIPFLKRFLTRERRNKTLDWMSDNKGVSLLGLEAANISIHGGMTNAGGMIFAIGNTLVNVVMIFGFLPARKLLQTGSSNRNVLKGLD